MEHEQAVKCLSELGNSTRLSVYRLLVRAGPEGMTVGDIQRRLDVPASTLSHHIAHLVWAGLIDQNREGRMLHCQTKEGVMDDLIKFLSAECCVGFDESGQTIEDTGA